MVEVVPLHVFLRQNTLLLEIVRLSKDRQTASIEQQLRAIEQEAGHASVEVRRRTTALHSRDALFWLCRFSSAQIHGISIDAWIPEIPWQGTWQIRSIPFGGSVPARQLAKHDDADSRGRRRPAA